jgi:hypothetical protein
MRKQKSIYFFIRVSHVEPINPLGQVHVYPVEGDLETKHAPPFLHGLG